MVTLESHLKYFLCTSITFLPPKRSSCSCSLCLSFVFFSSVAVVTLPSLVRSRPLTSWRHAPISRRTSLDPLHYNPCSSIRDIYYYLTEYYHSDTIDILLFLSLNISTVNWVSLKQTPMHWVEGFFTHGGCRFLEYDLFGYYQVLIIIL